MNKSNNNKEISFFKAKINTNIEIAKNKYYPKYTMFLDENQQQLAVEVLNHNKYTYYSFFGGYKNSTRNILCVFPDVFTTDDLDFPIKILVIDIPKNYKISHREVLGTLMGLQIKRETIGDILIQDNQVFVFVLEDVGEYIADNLTKISNVGVKISILDMLEIELEPKLEDVNIIVSSMRIDCVVASITRLSRSKSDLLINSAKVFKNNLPVTSNNNIVKINDIITIRGFGKYIISKDIRTTKSGRFCIGLKKYT